MQELTQREAEDDEGRAEERDFKGFLAILGEKKCVPACVPACLRAILPVSLRAILSACLPACLFACLPYCLPYCLPFCYTAILPALSHVSLDMSN